MIKTEGILHAYLLNGKGGAKALSHDELTYWTQSDGVLWIHLDYSDPKATDFLNQFPGLEPLAINALLMDETRPRATVIDNGLLMVLRGINRNLGTEDDMIALRMWLDSHLIITSRRRKLNAASQIVEQLQSNSGPKNSGDFLIQISYLITDDMAETIHQFEDKVDEYEDAVLEGMTGNLRYELATLRRQTITIRRYLSPQRDALNKLLSEQIPWFSNQHKNHLRETNDRLVRHIENLDAARERAAVTQEELMNRVSEQLNSRMYVLSVVAAIFLPLGFLTGLLGINVGGIPGENNNAAFWLFIVTLVVLSAAQIVLFRWKRWF